MMAQFDFDGGRFVDLWLIEVDSSESPCKSPCKCIASAAASDVVGASVSGIQLQPGLRDVVPRT